MNNLYIRWLIGAVLFVAGIFIAGTTIKLFFNIAVNRLYEGNAMALLEVSYSIIIRIYVSCFVLIPGGYTLMRSYLPSEKH